MVSYIYNCLKDCKCQIWHNLALTCIILPWDTPAIFRWWTHQKHAPHFRPRLWTAPQPYMATYSTNCIITPSHPTILLFVSIFACTHLSYLSLNGSNAHIHFQFFVPHPLPYYTHNHHAFILDCATCSVLYTSWRPTWLKCTGHWCFMWCYNKVNKHY